MTCSDSDSLPPIRRRVSSHCLFASPDAPREEGRDTGRKTIGLTAFSVHFENGIKCPLVLSLSFWGPISLTTLCTRPAGQPQLKSHPISNRGQNPPKGP